LSQQLLTFGRSGDGLGVLTFGVEQFSVLFVPGGQSTRVWRMVCAHSVRRVSFMFLLGFVFDPSWFQVLVGQGFGRSACSGRTVRGCLADSPRAPRGRSIIRGASLEVLVSFLDSPRLRPDGPRNGCGQSAIPCRTVRATFADSPPEAGSFVSWFDSFLLLSCFRVCFKESFLRLEVDP
jgi:hypothetical protein